MNQYQYEKKNTDDPFTQEEEELQAQEWFRSDSRQIEDLEEYKQTKEKKRTFRFRMISLAAAALILGPLSLAVQAKLRTVNSLDYVNEFETSAEEDDGVYRYDPVFRYYDFRYEGGADEYYNPGDGELGNDPGEPEIVLEGSYYHMPAPLHVFIENGWNVVTYNNSSDEIPKEVKEDGEEFLSLLKNGKLLQVYVGSPSGKTIPIENSYVVRFSVSNFDSIKLELPAGIRIGASFDESLSRMSEYGLALYGSGDNYQTAFQQRRLYNSGNYRYWNIDLSSFSDSGIIDEIFIYANN
ncbi:MAG: hypothetical protein K6G61_11830 [Solobacterium sp.]|nr:hypothetical protein [Solobacterium sp.]